MGFTTAVRVGLCWLPTVWRVLELMLALSSAGQVRKELQTRGRDTVGEKCLRNDTVLSIQLSVPKPGPIVEIRPLSSVPWLILLVSKRLSSP